MAALVAVMIMVSIGTFSWGSLRDLRTHPRSSSLVMLATVAVTVATHDLAMGVLTGRAALGLLLRAQGGQDFLRALNAPRTTAVRALTVIFGQVFFASADRFANAFDYKEVIDHVRIDVSRAHFWDITAISALDKVVMKFRREGTTTEVIGLNEASATMIDRFAVHDKPGSEQDLLLEQ
jgi:SulP family sulfate permease